MKILFAFILAIITWAFAGNTYCQRIGIKKANPTEAVDVHGNIQLTGTLKINGNQGTNGQVLTSTGNGVLWQPPPSQQTGAFTRWAMYNVVTSGTNWDVPAGTTEVMVEIWGGGGGGSAAGDMAGGGGSGAYSRAIIDVSQVIRLTIVVGKGGTGNAMNNAQSGDPSQVKWTRLATQYQIESAGGAGASSGRAGAGAPVLGANTIVPSTISLFQLPGTPGQPVKMYYTRQGNGEFWCNVIGTTGGTSYSFEQYPQQGSNYSFQPNNDNFLAQGIGTSYTGDNAQMPGQGGCSSPRINNNFSNGVAGMVIIRW